VADSRVDDPGQTMAPPIPASVPRSTGTVRPVAALAILIHRGAGAPLAEKGFQATAPWRLVIRNNNHW